MTRRTLLLAVLLLLFWSRADGGEVRRDLALPSPVLGRDIPYAVYLPDGHGEAGRRFPILYLLHGHGGRGSDWIDAGGLEPILDGLIERGAVPPLVVAMPSMGDGWYVDDAKPPGPGALQSAFLQDFVPGIERLWPVTGRRAGRAVAGLSMGGWGALRFAMLEPNRFVAAASLSGALVPPGAEIEPPWPSLYGAAFGTPFNPARARAASPFAHVEAFAAAGPRPALYLACGSEDELGLAAGATLFHAALKRAGVATKLRITDGGHDWTYWHRELGPMLRFVGATFLASAR
jgi:enterochelin esterase family protein